MFRGIRGAWRSSKDAVPVSNFYHWPLPFATASSPTTIMRPVILAIVCTLLATFLDCITALPTTRDNRHFSMMKPPIRTRRGSATETRPAQAESTHHPAPLPERAHHAVAYEAPAATETMSNAARMSQGLPIKAPRQRFDATKSELGSKGPRLRMN